MYIPREDIIKVILTCEFIQKLTKSLIIQRVMFMINMKSLNNS